MVLKNKDGKICIKGSRGDDKKRITKKELETMLMDEKIMGEKDKYSLTKAQKINYNNACQVLLEKDALIEEKITKKDNVWRIFKYNF